MGVEHIKVDKHGVSKLLIRLPISLRAGIQATAKRIGMSQQQAIISAIAAWLINNQVEEVIPVSTKPARRARKQKGGA